MVKVQSRGLGKGLAALIADVEKTMEPKSAAPAQEGAGGEGVREIHLVQIQTGKAQPRTEFDDASLKELADSISRSGVLQPVLLRALPGAREKYELIAGERRWRAAKLVGLKTIPAIVRELTDQQALEMALVENVQRVDLSPLEEAAGYQRLIAEFRYTQEALSQAVGKSRSHIANLLRLLELPEIIREMLASGKLTMGHARALIGLPERAALPIAREVAERHLSVRQAEALVRGIKPDFAPGASATPQSRPRAPRAGHAIAGGPKDPDILALEEVLSGNLGMKVEIREFKQESGQGGELAITYDSLTQLDEVLQRLGGGF